MYMLGSIVHSNASDIKLDRNLYSVGWLLCSLVTGIGSFFLMHISKFGWSWKFFSYNNPFIILGAALFCLIFLQNEEFKNCRMKKIIYELSSTSLAVYLISDCYIIKRHIFVPLVDLCRERNDVINILFIFLYAVGIYSIC